VHGDELYDGLYDLGGLFVVWIVTGTLDDLQARFAGSGPRRGAETLQGSRQLRPAVTAKASRRSATRRAIGPTTIISWLQSGRSTGSMVVA
jgi:hypothetical protein